MANPDIIQFEDKYSQEEDSLEIPREVRKINTQAYDKSVADIIRMINDNDINLNPEYQRNYIWDNKRASLLIESIILNVPIPVIYVSQEEDDSWTVIDGLQRLNSLKRFFDRDFKLTGLEILTDLSKSDVRNLNPKALRVLKNGLLRIIVIANDSHPEIKYDVFMRLNRGAVRLTEQELRNCLYRGKLNETIKSLAKDLSFLTLLNLEEPHKRMMDCELILRYIALVEKWDIQKNEIAGYKGRMKSFLNEYMYSNQNPTEEFLSVISNDFKSTADKVVSVYGVKAFRRVNESGEYEGIINRSLMDILMVSSHYFEKEKLIEKKDELTEALENLAIDNPEFKNSITIGTSDTKVITSRLKMWYEHVNQLVNG